MTDFEGSILRATSGVMVTTIDWNSAETWKVHDRLIDEGFIKRVFSPWGQVKFVVTEKGREALRAFGQDGTIEVPERP